jgi:hypothetical protein
MQEVRHDIPIQYSLWCPWETTQLCTIVCVFQIWKLDKAILSNAPTWIYHTL